ncbi:MAG TPA: hypothetical protein VMK12_09515 [Anaeromyxobacteraceae bacterium]|nr:hypothetical protein [Anaeromyxobacteraceae bacterium]
MRGGRDRLGVQGSALVAVADLFRGQPAVAQQSGFTTSPGPERRWLRPVVDDGDVVTLGGVAALISVCTSCYEWRDPVAAEM